jgi:hypothetical protein
MSIDQITYLVDEHQNPKGVLLSQELWEQVRKHVEPLVSSASPMCSEAPPVPEPIDDWETFLEYWDFKYPISTEVTCGHCNASTENWQADEPRKFHLLSATLGGLVSFRCQECKAKVIKRHFKDHMTTETQPHFECKDDRWIGVYGKNRPRP